MSNLYVNFRQNHLKQTNAIGLVGNKDEDLAGLPDGVVQAAAEMARARSMEGKWVFTLQKPSFIPFLMNLEKRDLREIVFKAYINHGYKGGGIDIYKPKGLRNDLDLIYDSALDIKKKSGLVSLL